MGMYTVKEEQYDADYFLRGRATGKSLYENYSWKPDLTIPMCQAIVEHCGIDKDLDVLDFGCARGYTVRALRELGYRAYGVDVSEWAIANCDPAVKEFVCLGGGIPTIVTGWGSCDWIVAKDVLEHVENVAETIDVLMMYAKRGVFAVVPLGVLTEDRYVVTSYEEDVTHVHRLTLASWVDLFARPGWKVECSYRVRGVKDNYYRPGWERGNGFLTARRSE